MGRKGSACTHLAVVNLGYDRWDENDGLKDRHQNANKQYNENK